LVLIAIASALSRVASAQSAPELPVSPVPSSPLHLELQAAEGVRLRIRPEIPGFENSSEFVICPPSCRLAIYPGRYRLESDAPAESGLRRVVSTFDLASDVRVEVAPGSRSENAWGVGLMTAGSVALGLATLFAFSSELGAHNYNQPGIETLALVAVGAPLTIGGIYLLVHSRNRVTVQETWQRSMVPAPPPAAAQVEVGARF
jgi:hypothetical protein